MKINEQIFLITGGAGFFGEFLCGYFLDQGAKKVILTDIDQVRLQSIKSKFTEVETFVCDLSDNIAVKDCVNQITANNKISVLINNAGWIHSEPLINLLNKDKPQHSFENWDKAIKLNLYSCFNITSYVAAFMVKNRTRGVIINISSIAAQGNLGQTAYSAAKAGIEAMTKTWSKELGPFKIRTAAIAPGFINTPSTQTSLSEQVLDKWKKQIPLGMLGELECIGNTAKFIIENDYVSGKVIAVDGGLTI